MAAAEAASSVPSHVEVIKDSSAVLSAPASTSSGEVPGLLSTPDSIVERVLDLKYKWSGTVYEVSSAPQLPLRVDSGSLFMRSISAL